jgi:hypothetical protein
MTQLNEQKAYDVEMEDRDGYLWVLASGDKLSAEISAAYWDEIADRCFAVGCKKVLIEKDFKRSVGPEDMIKMADHLGKLLPACRVAFVDRQRHDSINELGKKLARNRDVLMQIFDNADDAEKWLLAN